MKPNAIQALARSVSLLALVLLCAVAAPAQLQEDARVKLIQELLDRVRSTAPTTIAGLAVSVPAETPRFSRTSSGYLRHIGAPPGFHFPVRAVVPGKAAETARNFLREQSLLFGVENPAVDFLLLKSETANQRHYVRFQQTYAGVPLFAAQIIIQLDAQDGVQFVSSGLETSIRNLDEGKVSVVPGISAEQAAEKIRELLAAKAGQRKIETTPARLLLFSPALLEAAGDIRLVWEMRAYTEDRLQFNQLVLLDAHTGELVRNYPLNKAALDLEIYDANNTHDDGQLVRSEGQSPSGIADADDAYTYLGDTYNFYLGHHGRDGIDGDGTTIEVTVRYCDPDYGCPMNNAYWHWGVFSDHIYFGAGWAVDDVVAHEYTHGVTDYTSDLVYENASGAINESFSDCWGEFVDLTNGRGNDSPAVRWSLGEDTPGRAFRSMRNPHVSHLGSASYVSPTGDPERANDWGGVHVNNGINNKLCYLLTDGDTFNGQTIAGQGIDPVAALYYEVNAHLLGSDASYADLANAIRQAAVNLGWSASERENLYRALVAVEIAGIYVDNTDVCPMPTGFIRCNHNLNGGGPFPTVAAGVNAAASGEVLSIRAGSYAETLTINKPMEIGSYAGVATIGH